MDSLALLLLLIQVPIPAPINVNTATRAELLTIEGISPMVADHIIRDRPYTTVDDLEGAVPRFSFEKIRRRITVTSSRADTPPAPQPQRNRFQVISGNRSESIEFEGKSKPAGEKEPATERLPKETGEAEKGK